MLDTSNNREFTITLTRRELGLIEYTLKGLYNRIDSDVTEWGSSCTGYDTIEHDYYGKDAIVGAYKEVKTLVDKHYTNKKQLCLPKYANF